MIEYILPTEDLEDLNFIKDKFEIIEEYDFKEIIDKYNLSDSIILLIFKGENEIRSLSKMNIQNNIKIKNESFSNFNLNNNLKTNKMINQLKIIYEDYWKNFNQINTSIKLSLNIKVYNIDNLKIKNFEKKMSEIDLIYDFIIKKFDKDFTYYQVIFNGAPNVFLETMSENDYQFDIRKNVWLLK